MQAALAIRPCIYSTEITTYIQGSGASGDSRNGFLNPIISYQRCPRQMVGLENSIILIGKELRPRSLIRSSGRRVEDSLNRCLKSGGCRTSLPIMNWTGLLKPLESRWHSRRRLHSRRVLILSPSRDPLGTQIERFRDALKSIVGNIERNMPKFNTLAKFKCI